MRGTTIIAVCVLLTGCSEPQAGCRELALAAAEHSQAGDRLESSMQLDGEFSTEDAERIAEHRDANAALAELVSECEARAGA